MSKEKILLVHNYYQIPGGEDTVFQNELKMLKDNGHEVVTYTRNNKEINGYNILKKVLLPFKFIFSFKTYRDIKKIIKKENIDIVHVHNTLALISPAVFYAAKKMNVPVFQTIHNFRNVCPNGVLYRDNKICEDCINKGLHCSIKHSCYRNSKLQTISLTNSLRLNRLFGMYKFVNFICLTDFNKDKLLTIKSIPEEHVFVKPNFVTTNIDEIVPNNERLNQVVYVGRLDKLKGVDKLIDAWKNIDDTKLVICGTGPLKDYVEEVTKNNTNIEYRGFVDHDSAMKLISESLSVILPTTWYEGFPMTIVESISLGTPIIVSNVGNSKDIIERIDKNLVLNSINKNEIQNCISYIKNTNLNNSLRKYYNDNFSFEKNYECLVDIYKKIKSKEDIHGQD